MIFTKRQHFLLAIISGLLFAFSWPMRGFAPAIFLAFIPILMLEESIRLDSRSYKSARIFGFSFLAFGVWNLLTTYWIYNAAAIGLIMALFVNGSLMSLAVLVYHKLRNQFRYSGGGQFLLILPWISYEYLHQDWDMTWSWLNIGNVFGPMSSWVQWYEYTGAFGGALWIFIVNIFLFRIIRSLMQQERKPILLNASLAVLSLAFPLLASSFLYRNYSPTNRPYEVVVVQPNIDPYNEKYGGMPYPAQMELMNKLAGQEGNSRSSFFIFPESAIQESLWEGVWDASYSIDSVERLNARFPEARIIMGASTYRTYEPGEPLRVSARYLEWDDSWYDAFNAVLFFEDGKVKGVYHKSKLVAGVERMPFSKYLQKIGFVKDLSLDFGGIVGTLGTDEVRKVFVSDLDSLRFSSVICFESVYGGYFAEFVRNGAELVFIVTNDGWWGNTAGYRQHFMFAPLRAIETRRCIARSANTGISAFISQRGDIMEQTEYWEEDVIRAELNANDKLTFYVRHGDYIARIALFLTLLFLLIALVRWILERSGRKARLAD
jgi:apolipoprotein N-acyltransferase